MRVDPSRAWVGKPPRAELDDQVDVYRGYSADAAVAHWGTDELIGSTDAGAVADALAAVARRAGTDALNVRVH